MITCVPAIKLLPITQEVDAAQYEEYFMRLLEPQGYDGIFSPKSRARTMSESQRRHVDGCAIFFKKDK